MIQLKCLSAYAHCIDIVGNGYGYGYGGLMFHFIVRILHTAYIIAIIQIFMRVCGVRSLNFHFFTNTYECSQCCVWHSSAMGYAKPK